MLPGTPIVHALHFHDIFIRLVVAAVLGVLIGFERQWRHRSADIQTTGLVATGAALFCLQNYKQEPFTPDSLRALSTPGVVFILDVPRVADPVRVFDQMRLAAKRMTHTLEGVLVDDNRRELTDASLTAIRGQVQATAAALREAHIEPGGARALRLFG